MTKRARKLLFIICFVLFLIVAPFVVFYSQGYRLDWNLQEGGIKITQTGGLFLKVWPKQVEIYLDSKLVKKTDWFFGSVLIESLLPKRYKVLIKKESFHSWEKTLEIREKRVTEAKNIILFPQNPNLSFLAQEIKSFWFSPDQKRIIFKTDTSEKEPNWSLKLYDIEGGVQNHLIEENELHPKGADLLGLEFSSDSKRLNLQIGAAEKIKFFELEIDRIPPTLIEKESPSVPLNIVTHLGLNDGVYYLSNLGHLFKTDLNFESQIKITAVPFSLLPETEYELEVFGDFIFLRENQSLYLLNPESKSFEKFFTSLTDLKVSPDFDMVVYWSDYEIWILFLREKVGQSLKTTGEKLFLIRLSEKIGDIVWLNSDYLAFTLGDRIQIIEIDERDKLNVVSLIEIETPKIFFNSNNKKLYILSGGVLYQSPKLLP